MNGADALIATLVKNGVDVCFTNPGTSEMQFVTAIDKVEGMRAVLALFEGVATGAADGYARMAGKPASTLLHLGPGLGNGLANLHNAKRAHSPVINIVGDHATYHRGLDAPLTSDVEGVAKPFSHWIHTATSADTLADDGIKAIEAASVKPGAIATLIVPADCAWDPADGPSDRAPVLAARDPVEDKAISAAVDALNSGEPCGFLINDLAGSEAGLALLARIAAKTGARVIADTFVARIAKGAGRGAYERLNYFGEGAVEQLTGLKHLILVGTKAPVSFFAYPGKPSHLTPEGCEAMTLAPVGSDVLGALEAVAEGVGAPAEGATHQLNLPDAPTGELNAVSAWQAMAHHLPEGAILSDESTTSGLGADMYMNTARPHDLMLLTGGSIGFGLPVAVGAAIACPDRKVVCPHGDGGAMYTIQALWTMAREQLDVTTVIFNNRSYAILNIELMRVGAENPGRKALDMLDLSRPNLDFVALAQGMGVEASRAATAEEFSDQFGSAMAGKGPRLIEVMM